MCHNIHECLVGTHDCDENSVCIEESGSFNCSCNPGYSGDGRTCENIDECSLGSDMCAANATCDDTTGSYRCSCSAGLQSVLECERVS